MKKILKKVAATILAASMVIGMTACGTGGGGSSTQGGTSSNKSGKIKIGVSIWSSTDVLGSQCKKILDEAAKALDVDVHMWIRDMYLRKLPLLLSSWQQQDVRELSSVTHLIQR